MQASFLKRCIVLILSVSLILDPFVVMSQGTGTEATSSESSPSSETGKLLQTLSEAQKQELERTPPEQKQETPEVQQKQAARKRLAPAGRARSRIERILSGEFPTDISPELKQFGYDFFKKDISTFTPITNVPVGGDYVIGPGDNFKIHLWGKVEQTYDVTVNRDGRIIIPRLGAVSVIGLTYDEMRDHLRHKFKEYYPEFDMTITMGRLRTIQIFVVGEAENPGTYSVSSLSTLITALFTTGGPSKSGSLRSIKLYRNSLLIRELDLYDFFLKGDKSQDHRLDAGDTIFIPLIGPVVGVSGIVKRPAIYEMKGEQTIADVIRMAGGVLPIGYLQNVIIERVEGHRRRIVKSFNIDPQDDRAGKDLVTPLGDGDLVKIFPIHAGVGEVVYLQGHVKYPREYALKPGMRISDLIPSFNLLLSEPYLPLAEIIRLVPPDYHPEIVEFNLGKMLEGDQDHNLLLQDLDRIRIYHKWEKKREPQVTIKGEVRNPGSFRLYESMTVRDLIFQAGNLTRKADLEKGSLSRVIQVDDGMRSIEVKFSPREAMLGNTVENVVLKEDDTVYIRGIPEYSETLAQKVTLTGEFLYPGEYGFKRGQRLMDVIRRAGGPTAEAYPRAAIFTRQSVKELQRQRINEYIARLEEEILTISALAQEVATDEDQVAIMRESLASKRQLLNKLRTSEVTGRMIINLPEALASPDSGFNVELRPGDQLFIPQRSDTVVVLGEVYNPTAILIVKAKGVGYYINKVGGMTKNAEKGDVYLVKADGSVYSKRQTSASANFGWDNEQNRWQWGGFESIEVEAGDTIIVPKKVVRYPWLRVTKDITTIIFQIAFAAGVLIAAFRR